MAGRRGRRPPQAALATETPSVPAATEWPDNWTWFVSDGHPDGYAVACGEPGISGRWVSGATRAETQAHWLALYAAGELRES